MLVVEPRAWIGNERREAFEEFKGFNEFEEFELLGNQILYRSGRLRVDSTSSLCLHPLTHDPLIEVPDRRAESWRATKRGSGSMVNPDHSDFD
jgi:hypothetical protein